MELPKHNSEYLVSSSPNFFQKQEYWNDRFKKEDQYEWLVSFSDIKSELLEVLP